MKKILKFIFSVSKENGYKIFCLLGLKIKFKQSISINDLNNSLNTFNHELAKNFIVENINNPLFFNIEQFVYNYFEEIKSRKFYPIFRNRINKFLLENKLFEIEKTSKKEVVLVSDIPEGFISNKFKIIRINQIYTLQNKDYCIVMLFNQDFNGIKAINELRKYNLKYISQFNPFPMARYFHTDEIAFETLLDESNNENWHFCPIDFENIFQAINNCKDLEGVFLEIGTFKGDSASAALNYMTRKKINKQAYFLDTFTGFDYTEAINSEDAQWQNTHSETSYEKVKNRLSQYKNAHIIQSNIISNELPQEIDKICVANIDVDMYEAVKAALYKVKDKVVQNGIIIAEDYGHTPALIGAQKAVREFLEENPNDFLSIYLNSGQMFLIKK